MENFTDQLIDELVSVRLMDMIKSYDLRNRAVIKAVWLALMCNMKAGFRIDPQEPEWPVAYIELPTGQITYHLPQHENAWDQHDTETKNARIQLFVS